MNIYFEFSLGTQIFSSLKKNRSNSMIRSKTIGYRQYAIQFDKRRTMKKLLIFFILLVIAILLWKTHFSDYWKSRLKFDTNEYSTSSMSALLLLPPKEQIKKKICGSSLEMFTDTHFKRNLPILYIITPTYKRREQVNTIFYKYYWPHQLGNKLTKGILLLWRNEKNFLFRS